jgi:hypothetical protein
MDKLKIFISWSGDWSKQVAEALRGWLPDVLQFSDPWMSAGDIEKGARWASEIARELEVTRVGVICLTPENLRSPWILFESGALSKTTEDTYVCTYLHGLTKTDLTPPVSQFQATEAEKEDTRKLVRSINQAYSASPLSQEQCDRAFERCWPELERHLTDIMAAMSGHRQTAPARSDRAILEEVLEITRGLRRDSATPELYWMLSHELRTPVNAILGYSALLSDGVFGDLTAEQSRAVQRLTDAAKHQLVLLNELMDRDMSPAKLKAILMDLDERFKQVSPQAPE